MCLRKCFFEPGCGSCRFDGLEIYREREHCGKYTGRFPAISISLKDVGDTLIRP
ncbi:MAG: hypothetical protein HFH95_05280 [Lachnospiraceae bacterium]|nr:hypothetical protein [Lachnospiraceae bacterium]